MRSFKMFAFDGLHGSGSEIGVLGPGSIMVVEPIESIAGATFTLEGVTAFTTQQLTCTRPVLVRLNTATSIFPSATPPKVRLAMVSSVTTLEPTPMFEVGTRNTSQLVPEGTTLGLTAYAVVTIVEPAPTSTGLAQSVPTPSATGKPFPWVPALIGFVAVSGFVWWVVAPELRNSKLRDGYTRRR